LARIEANKAAALARRQVPGQWQLEQKCGMRLTRPRRQARLQQAQPAAVATQPNPNPKEQQNPKPSLFFRSPVEQACDSSRQLPQAAVAAAPTARASAGGGEGGGERHLGTIKAYDAVKGFGFIVSDGDRILGLDDLFCHRSELPTGPPLLAGQRVSFELKRVAGSSRRPRKQAARVALEGGSAPGGASKPQGARFVRVRRAARSADAPEHHSGMSGLEANVTTGAEGVVVPRPSGGPQLVAAVAAEERPRAEIADELPEEEEVVARLTAQTGASASVTVEALEAALRVHVREVLEVTAKPSAILFAVAKWLRIGGRTGG
jgi:cold shock CspA family protein